MRVSTRRMRFSKRRSRRKTAFPLVAVVPKRNKPQYSPTPSFTQFGKSSDSSSVSKRSIKRSRATIDYKNVVLLRKLITAEGKILPRRINRLTAKQQRYSSKAIKTARIMALLPFINKTRPV